MHRLQYQPYELYFWSFPCDLLLCRNKKGAREREKKNCSFICCWWKEISEAANKIKPAGLSYEHNYFPVSVFDFSSHFILRNYNTDLSFLHAPTCNNFVIPSWFTVQRGKAPGLVSPVKHWKDFTAVWHIQVSLSGSVKRWNRCSQSFSGSSKLPTALCNTYIYQDSWCNHNFCLVTSCFILEPKCLIAFDLLILLLFFKVCCSISFTNCQRWPNQPPPQIYSPHFPLSLTRLSGVPQSQAFN